MKKLKVKIAVIIILAASVINIKAQSGYVITKEGKKENIYGSPYRAAENGDALMYMNTDGKKKHYMGDDIKYATYKDTQFGQMNTLTLSYKGGSKVCLQEVICYNDKYILTRFYEYKTHMWNYISVYDWNFNPVVQFKKTGEAGMLAKKVDKIGLITEIEPYFKDCPDVISAMKANVSDPNSPRELTDKIYNIQCGKKSFATLIQPFLDGKTNNGKKVGGDAEKD